MDELTDASDDLTVDVTIEAEHTVVIALAGEIDMNTAKHIRSEVARAASLQARRIVFDMSGVEFMDSSGIASLIEARDAAATIALRKPSPSVQRLLVIAGLTEILPVEP